MPSSKGQKNRKPRGSPKNPQTSLLQQEEKKVGPVMNGLNLFKAVENFTPLFPIQTRKRLIYYEPALSLTGTAGVFTNYVFTANGLYDVDITSTGHQPIGWDQLMLFYEQATVLSSRITIRMVNNGAQAAAVGIALVPDAVSSANSTTLMENGLNTSVLSDGRGSNGTGQRIHTLSLSCDVAKYFGRPSPRNIVNDPLLYTTAAANPTEQVYYHISTWSTGGTVDNTAMFGDVLIEFDAIFWEPRKAPLSLSRLQEIRDDAELRRRLSSSSVGLKDSGVSRDEGKR